MSEQSSTILIGTAIKVYSISTNNNKKKELKQTVPNVSVYILYSTSLLELASKILIYGWTCK